MKLAIKILLIFILSSNIKAQGPELSYFYNPNTYLPWAEAFLKFKSGSKLPIKFFPVNDLNRSPCGTSNYSIDVSIENQLIFIPEIEFLSKNSSLINNVKSRSVLYCYDIVLKNDKEKSLSSKLSELIKNGAISIILFSRNEEYPFIRLSDSIINPEIPIITVSKTTATSILEATGYDTKELWENWNHGIIPILKKPILVFNLRINGKFDLSTIQNSTIRYKKTIIDSTYIKKLTAINDSALRFVYHLFRELKPAFKKKYTTYFSDYDEKLFYTSHWGKGLADSNGVFSVYDGSPLDFELSVHELTHYLFNDTWNGNSSFLSEGIAMFAEAQVSNSKKNHIKTLMFLKSGFLLPLKDLKDLQIGLDKSYTEMGYSASGSFVGFLIENYGFQKFLEFWKSNQEWEKVFKKNMAQLEIDWHMWLENNVIINKK